jgi:hypothetical protein
VSEAERAVFELVRARSAPDLTWLRARADLDLATVDTGRRELGARCTEQVRWLLVEVGADCFVALRGLRMLRDVACTLRERGATLLLVSDSSLLCRVLQIMGLNGDLPLRGSAREAQEEVDRNGHR